MFTSAAQSQSWLEQWEKEAHPDEPEWKAETLRAVLKNYESLVLAARYDIGLESPDWGRG